MRYLYLFVFLAILSCIANAQHITRGKVVDQEEHPISNVKINEQGTGNIAYTNDKGEFTLNLFGSDSRVIFTHDSYDTFNRSLPFDEYTLVFLNPDPDANDYHLGYLVGFLDFKHKNKNKNLHNMPYFLGESDINRQLQMLPGIEQGNEGYSNLFVRGGEVDQNLLLYNGSPVYNSNHLFGLSSTFHHRSIENTSIYRGIAPAKYGGRGSSIISLESKKNGDYSGLEGEFEITPLNAGIYIESIKKDISYFTVAARRSWIDLLIPVESKQNEFNANIYDLQVNFGKKLKNKDAMDFSILSTRDLYFIAFRNTDTTSGNNSPVTYGFTQKWSNLVTSFKYTQNISTSTTAEHSIHYSGYKSTTELKQETFNIQLTSIPTTKRLLTRGVRDIGLQSNWQHHLNNKHSLSFGLQTQSRLLLIGRYDYTAVNYPDLEDINTVEGNPKYELAQEVTLYGEDKFRFSDEIIFDLGLRSTYYHYNDFNKVVVEPRLHATIFLENKDVLKAGYNRHNQFINQLNLGQTGGPSNLWVPATSQIAPQIVNTLEAGYERKLGSIYSASMNIYLKTMENLLQVTNLNDAGDPELDWQTSVVQGEGRSFGAELFLQKSKGTFTGWISYAYSKSTRNFAELYDEDFLFTYDRPHMLKVYANYTKETSPWNFGVNYIIGSGQLFTLPIGKFRDINGNIQLEYNTLNNYRSPFYHRIDFSLAKIKDAYGMGQEFRFYLYNALGYRNPLYVSADFTDNTYQELQVHRNYLAFVPGISYVVKF
ncbi:MAG: hypothetical protein COA58_03510 [Bacteroidetes bacterium]|nr:MAG: hypothetical protein COA58_03510 [Bacteroidota bacterium]